MPDGATRGGDLGDGTRGDAPGAAPGAGNMGGGSDPTRGAPNGVDRSDPADTGGGALEGFADTLNTALSPLRDVYDAVLAPVGDIAGAIIGVRTLANPETRNPMSATLIAPGLARRAATVADVDEGGFIDSAISGFESAARALGAILGVVTGNPLGIASTVSMVYNFERDRQQQIANQNTLQTNFVNASRLKNDLQRRAGGDADELRRRR